MVERLVGVVALVLLCFVVAENVRNLGIHGVAAYVIAFAGLGVVVVLGWLDDRHRSRSDK